MTGVCHSLAVWRRAGQCCLGLLVLLLAMPTLAYRMVAIDPFGAEREIAQAIAAKTSTAPALASCVGEYEPYRLRILPADKRRALQLVVSPFRSGDNSLAPEHVDVRLVKYWYQGGTAGEAIEAGPGRRLVPELLVKNSALLRVDRRNKRNALWVPRGDGGRYIDAEMVYKKDRHQYSRVTVDEFPIADSPSLQPFALEAGDSQDLWLTFRAPEGSIAGDYRGELKLLDADTGEVLATHAIQWRLHAFELARSRELNSIYYRGQLASRGTISSEYKSAEQLRAELVNMREHGIDNPTVYQAYHDDIHGSRLDDYLLLRKQLGFDNQELFYLGMTLGHPRLYPDRNKLDRATRRLEKVLRRHYVHDFYIYAMEELDQRRMRALYPLFADARERGYKLFTTGYDGTWDVIGAALSLYIAKDLSVEKAARVNAAGQRIFMHKPQGGVEDPARYRKQFGVDIWRHGYDGIMPYAYQSDYHFPWNDFDDPKYRDHAFTYPTRDGVIDTIAWEALREAIDDRRYLASLQAILDAGPATQSQQACFDTAQAYLDALRQRDAAIKPAQMREQLAAHLARLSSGCSVAAG